MTQLIQTDPVHYEEILEIAARDRIPISAMIELTHRCVFRCRHCHVWPRADVGRELSTETWLRILGEMSAAGTLFLTFSGGEPFLRDDLFTLVDHAVRLGTFVTVFTNGFLLTPDDASRLASAGVGTVEISFYSNRPDVFDRVTGIPGSFDRVVENLRHLRKAKVPVNLKTPVMRSNYRTLPETFDWAADQGFPFRADFALFPDDSPTACNREEFLDEAEFEEALGLAAAFQLMPSCTRAEPSDPICLAGHRYCAVDPEGQLYMCTLIPLPAGDLTQAPFKEVWRRSPVLDHFRRLDHRSRPTCLECDLVEFCSRCPALFYRTGGGLTGVTDAVCREARVRARLAQTEPEPGKV